MSYSAGAFAAAVYCDKVTLNMDFVEGYLYATGIEPQIDPYYRSEFHKFEKQATQDNDGFCKAMRLMFYRGDNSKPLEVPLLIDKP